MRGNSICRGSEARAGLRGAQSQMQQSCLVQSWDGGREKRWEDGAPGPAGPKAKFRGNGEPWRVAAGDCGRTGIAFPSPLDAEWRRDSVGRKGSCCRGWRKMAVARGVALEGGQGRCAGTNG